MTPTKYNPGIKLRKPTKKLTGCNSKLERQNHRIIPKIAYLNTMTTPAKATDFFCNTARVTVIEKYWINIANNPPNKQDSAARSAPNAPKTRAKRAVETATKEYCFMSFTNTSYITFLAIWMTCMSHTIKLKMIKMTIANPPVSR
jgi:hypothetical protein